MKQKEKLRAVELRKKGKSYSEILKKISVCKSTLSLWLRDVELTSKQLDDLYKRGRERCRYNGAKANQQKRIERTKLIIEEAKKESRILFKNPLFLSGLMLYWAEGTKKGEVVDFSNSDPEMIKLMMKWFRSICKVPEEKFKINLYIHELHCRKDIEKYWSSITKVPLSQFHKTQIKSTTLKHRKNPLYDGTCSVRIYNKDLFRKIKGWRIGVLKKIDR
ncbi:hypothetical protein KKH07_00635 [Patescibacteria group bacterium]|nr:hypothetical protein [Patescibacteria group bacterium]MBU1563599.1 hypothetical protein [Patescibacteria group bacterium]